MRFAEETDVGMTTCRVSKRMTLVTSYSCLKLSSSIYQKCTQSIQQAVTLLLTILTGFSQSRLLCPYWFKEPSVPLRGEVGAVKLTSGLGEIRGPGRNQGAGRPEVLY